MRPLILAVLVCLTVVPVFSESISIQDYLQSVLDQSASVATAKKQYENSIDEYESAVRNKESSYTINMALIDSEYQKFVVTDTENNELVTAFQNLFSYRAAKRSYDSAIVSNEIAEAQFKRAQERFNQDLISLKEKHNSYLKFLQAQDSLDSARQNLNKAANAAFRALGYNPETTVVSGILLDVELPDVEELAMDSETDARMVQLRSQLELDERKLETLKQSSLSSPQELEELTDMVEEYRTGLQDRFWEVEDFLTNYRFTIDSLDRSREITEITITLKQLDLDTARVQFDYGEIYSSDVLQAELDYQNAINSRQSMFEELFIEYLSAFAFTGQTLLVKFGI